MEQALSAAPHPSDHALIERVLGRDEPALAELYRRFGALVFGVALRITRDRAVAEEVVQDVFHAIWRTAAGFQPEGRVSAWILGIARHRAIDATRARQFRSRQREQAIDPALDMAAHERTEDHVERRIAREQVRAALLRLPAAQREVLGLAFYAGMSHTEIAAHLGAPVGTVKTRVRLGLQRLRRQLPPAL